MEVDALIRRIRNLEPPAAADSLLVFPLSGNAYVGVRTDGAATLFFQLESAKVVTGAKVSKALDILVSSHFSVVSVATGSKTSIVAGLALILRDTARLWCFAVLAAAVDEALSLRPTSLRRQDEVEQFIENWVDFFSAAGLTTERIIGLWGELYIITCCADRDRAVATWLGPFGHPYDFAGNGVTLEVKTGLATTESWFSLEQMNRKNGFAVFVRALADRVRGVSLEDLVDDIAKTLSNRRAFERALASVGYVPGCGGGLKLTAEGILALPLAAIPRPVAVDARIRRVRFVVDSESLRNDSVPVRILLRNLEKAPKRGGRRARA